MKEIPPAVPGYPPLADAPADSENLGPYCTTYSRNTHGGRAPFVVAGAICSKQGGLNGRTNDRGRWDQARETPSKQSSRHQRYAMAGPVTIPCRVATATIVLLTASLLTKKGPYVGCWSSTLRACQRRPTTCKPISICEARAKTPSNATSPRSRCPAEQPSVTMPVGEDLGARPSHARRSKPPGRDLKGTARRAVSFADLLNRLADDRSH